MEKHLAPGERRSKPVDPMRLHALLDGNTLSLAGGNWTEGKGRALGGALNPGITALTLADNFIDERGAKVLAKAFDTPGAAGISTLDMSSCRLTDRAMSIFAPALAVGIEPAGGGGGGGGQQISRRARVKTLSLAQNTALGDNGVTALTLVGPSTMLVNVSLSRCGITAAGAVAVAELLHSVATLERLTLSWNTLGSGAGPWALRQALQAGSARLTFLDLGHCSLGRLGAVHIVRGVASDRRRVLRELSLRGNGLDVTAAEEIAGMLCKGTGLVSLDVSRNSIGIDGAAALLTAAEASGGAAGVPRAPIALNISGCSLRHDPRTYPPPPRTEDPAEKNADGNGRKNGKRSVVAPPLPLPKEIVPGLYRCDLGEACGRAVAAMLCSARETQGPQAWRRVTLEGAPVPDSVVATWPEALLLPIKHREVGPGPWLEVAVGLAAAGVPASLSKLTPAMSPERFEALWRRVTCAPAGAPSSEWLVDYARALANAGLFFTSAQAAKVVEDVGFASARVDVAVALWPRVVDPVALNILEAQLGVRACRAVRGRLNASHALRLDNPTGRYHLHMSRAYDRSVAVRLIGAYAEESAAAVANTLVVRSRLVGRGVHVGDAEAACVRGAWLNGKPAIVGDVLGGGGNVTAAAAAAWQIPADGVLTIDYVSHAKRARRDAVVMSAATFERLLAHLARATREDAATVAAAAVAPSPFAQVEVGAMGVEGYTAQQHATIVAGSEVGDVRETLCPAVAEVHPLPAGSWLVEATAVSDGSSFLQSAGVGRTLTSKEVTAWHARLGFAATLEEAAAAAGGAEPLDVSVFVTEADLLTLLRCHELQPGALLVRQFDPLALVPIAVMEDSSPEGLLVELAGDTLELLVPPPAFVLRPGNVVDAFAYVVPGSGFEEHSHPATLRASRDVQVLGGGTQPLGCSVLASTAAALRSLRVKRPAAFEALRKAISKSSFPLGSGFPAPKPLKQAVTRIHGNNLNPAEVEAARVVAIKVKVVALAAAAAAAAAGPNPVGVAAAHELLRSVAAAHAFTSVQVQQVLRRVPWSSAAAAEDAAVTLFCRTVDPEAGFTHALRVLPAASQMRVCQRLGWLNVLHLNDVGMHFRLRLWRADECLALATLLRMAHTCAKPALHCRTLKLGDAPDSMRSPAPGWRGVTIVSADGSGSGAEGLQLTIVPVNKSTPEELSALFRKALQGDTAARRITVYFRFDITAEETRACAAQWIQDAVRAWIYKRMFRKQRAVVVRLQVNAAPSTLNLKPSTSPTHQLLIHILDR